MRLSLLIGTCAALAACIAADAQAREPLGIRGSMAGESPACAAAKQSAWFERQRQLTDGDVDPAKAIPAQRECVSREAMQTMQSREVASVDVKSRDAGNERTY